jgi:glycerate dehydrogenase
MDIVILDGYVENPGDLSWEGFEKLGRLTVYDHSKPDEVVNRIGCAEAVITNKTVLSAEILHRCPSVRYIGVLATGYNVVDIAAASESGITVTNIPAYGTNAVAQFAIALLLEICHRIGHHSDAVNDGRWASSPEWCFWDYPLIELAGKTFGVIGYGRIGRAAGKIASALGMNVIAYDVNPSGEGSFVLLGELLAASDVISLHCPLLPETEGLINKDTIAKMKDGVIIINNSRGPLIVEKDLADALNGSKVYAAGLDVVSVEPIRPDNPLLNAKNCLITPHISWAPKESRKRLMDIAVRNLRAWKDGRAINAVNSKIPFELAVDPFYSESNQAYLRKAIEALDAGKGVEHELIEVED